MRVLHVMEATIGGTRRHLVDVTRGQLACGLDVHLAVATERDPDFLADLAALEREGAGVTRLPMTRSIRPGRDAADYRSLVRLLRQVGPDIVHTHSSKAGVLGRAASLRTGIGHRVHTPHTFAFLFAALFGPAKRWAYRSIETWFARRTERVIAVSDTEAETFRESGVVTADRIRVVRNGIDPGPYREATPLDLARLGLDPTLPTAAVIGLVYAAKGQDLALEALAGPGCERLQLLIVGPGDTSALEAQAGRLGVAARVRFLGARRDVPSILAALDFLLLASRWEGLPYVVLEAMASGLPVVSTPVDGALDLIIDEETGLLAREISADALHAVTRRMLELGEAERSGLGAAGRLRMLAGYTVEQMVEGLGQVYAELA